MTTLRVLGSGAVVALAFAACGTSEPETTVVWAVDCVAISGAMQLTALTPLESVPYTGLPREKYLGDLTDQQIGVLCDFERCLADNGYRYVCNPYGKESFRLEADPLFAEAAISCYSTPNKYMGQYSVEDSHEDCVDFSRRYFSSCHVAVLEDCLREQFVRPFSSRGYLVACDAEDRECGG